MTYRARIVSLALAVVSFAAAGAAQGCGGAATPEPTTPGPAPGAGPAVPAPSPAPSASTSTTGGTTRGTTTGGGAGLSQEGGPCSDDVAIQKKCAPGLTCAPPPPNAPVSEHTPGVCKRTP